ncbi:hypothetical protein BST61_g685 [Cercospora zeina]
MELQRSALEPRMLRPHANDAETRPLPSQSPTTKPTFHDHQTHNRHQSEKQTSCPALRELKRLASWLLAPYNDFFHALGQVSNQYERTAHQSKQQTDPSDIEKLVAELNEEAGVQAMFVRAIRLNAETGGYGTMDHIENWRSEVPIKLESLLDVDDSDLFEFRT